MDNSPSKKSLKNSINSKEDDKQSNDNNKSKNDENISNNNNNSNNNSNIDNEKNIPNNEILNHSSKNNLNISNNDINNEINNSYIDEETEELKDKVNTLSKNKINISKANLEENEKRKISKLDDYKNNHFEMYDFLFPGGKLAKMCKINNEEKTTQNIPILMKILNLEDPNPIIMLLGMRDSGRSKFLTGLTRSAFRTDAIIIDSGISTGIEAFCIRRGVNLIGVFPEFCIKLPKINPSMIHPDTLTNGHSHLFMLNKKEEWGDEIEFKFNLATELSKGSLKKRQEMPQCKSVAIFTGEHENSQNEIIKAIDNEIPIIIVKGSDISDNLINYINKEDYILSDEIKNKLEKAHLFPIDSNKSEDLASLTHFLLTVKPY